MNESFLWYLWKYRLYHPAITTTDGDNISVEYPGQQNADSGPDFSHARVRIGATLWAGNVEVHTRSSDWLRHGHQHDRAFDNVILHVVYENDVVISRPDGQVIPVVELKDKFDSGKWEHYRRLMKSGKPIPCSSSITTISVLEMEQWLDRTLISRLERKTIYINKLLELYKGSFEEVFYQLLAANFGFKVNAIPFELLARSLEHKVLIRHSASLLQTEALLFGQAGLLEDDFTEEYPIKLQKEYRYLKKKLHLIGLEKKLWKFSRMHPANFPTIRISQFAVLFQKRPHILSSILNCLTVVELKKLFEVKAHEYWDNHFTFGEETEASDKNLGDFAVENIIINTIVPFLFYYGKYKGDEHLCSKAIGWLEHCLAENNAIIREWGKLGVKAINASHSQSLIELKNEYCVTKNCLNCRIGLKLLQQTENDSRSD